MTGDSHTSNSLTSSFENFFVHSQEMNKWEMVRTLTPGFENFFVHPQVTNKWEMVWTLVTLRERP